MSGLDESHAMQVVKVRDDHTYQLDEAAPTQVLLRDDAKDLPVAVVSVVGAYRGGMSFLLNFFLKYLKATATSEAALMSAEKDAREVYVGTMEAICGPGEPSMPAIDLHREHRQALQAARHSFTSKKKMGSQKDIDDYLAKIMADLETHLPSYEALNDAKLKSAYAKVNKVYDDTILEVSGDQILCLHPNDLEVLHMKAVTKAIEVFDTLRTSADPDNDEERNALVKNLEDYIKELCNKNHQNNMVLVMMAQDQYLMHIASSMDTGTLFSEPMLERRHREGLDNAMHMFRSKRNIENYDSDDIYLEMLEKIIKEQHSKNALINMNANRTAVQAALHTYNNYITSTWGPQVYCLHPDDLTTVHQNAMETALDEFTSNRTSGDDEEDPDKNRLIESLERRHAELKDVNVICNNRAVDEAYNHYSRKMESKCKPSLLSILILPWVVKVLKQFPDFHATAKREALELFQSRRRPFRSHSSDEYYDKLESKLDHGHDFYCHPLRALARELGA